MRLLAPVSGRKTRHTLKEFSKLKSGFLCRLILLVPLDEGCDCCFTLHRVESNTEDRRLRAPFREDEKHLHECAQTDSVANNGGSWLGSSFFTWLLHVCSCLQTCDNKIEKVAALKKENIFIFNGIQALEVWNKAALKKADGYIVFGNSLQLLSWRQHIHVLCWTDVSQTDQSLTSKHTPAYMPTIKRRIDWTYSSVCPGASWKECVGVHVLTFMRVRVCNSVFACPIICTVMRE